MHTCSALKLLSVQLSWWVKATYALAAMRGLKCRKVISFSFSVWRDTSTPLTHFSGLKQSCSKCLWNDLNPYSLKPPFLSIHSKKKKKKKSSCNLFCDKQIVCTRTSKKKDSHTEALRVAMTTEWRRRYLRAAFNYVQRRQSFNNKICAHF